MPEIKTTDTTEATRGTETLPGAAGAPELSGATPEVTVARPAAGAGWARRLKRSLWSRRGRVRPRSLRGQLALGSALLAVGAIVLVSVTVLLGTALTFHSYQSTQLQNQVTQLADALGQARAPSALPPLPFARGAVAREARGDGGAQVWMMDAAGNLVVSPELAGVGHAVAAHDAAVVTPALRLALHGATGEGELSSAPFFALNRRWYAVAPIHAQDAQGRPGPIIGAVALTTPPRADRGAAFASSVALLIALTTLIVALLAAGVAALFSRSLIRPLDRLTQASARMAEGDYSARIEIGTPQELARVGGSFNNMAAALERDVAELHHQEALRRELVANVSHELATPLTAIQGFTEALQDGVVHDPQQRQEILGTIAREAARLQRLVDQLREVARVEAGVTTLDRTGVQLPALVEATLAVAAPEAERKQITLVTTLPPDLPAVYADEDRVTQILLNLLDNALRYTPVGGAITVAGALETSAGKACVRISVGDSGPGIAEAERARVFDRFYRGDPSRSTATGGSGLGLAITRALVEAHGGSIRVDANADGAHAAVEGGARFSFTLPVDAGDRARV